MDSVALFLLAQERGNVVWQLRQQPAQQRARQQCLRMREHLPHLPLFNDLPAVDRSDAMHYRLDHLHFMGDEQNGDAEPLVERFQQREDSAGGFRIERRGRLVAQQQRRARCQRARNADALFLAA